MKTVCLGFILVPGTFRQGAKDFGWDIDWSFGQSADDTKDKGRTPGRLHSSGNNGAGLLSIVAKNGEHIVFTTCVLRERQRKYTTCL